MSLWDIYKAKKLGIFQKLSIDVLAGLKLKAPANIWDEEWETGTIKYQDGQNGNSGVTLRSKNYIPVEPSTVYTFNSVSTRDKYVMYYDADKNYTNNYYAKSDKVFTFQTHSNVKFIRFAYHYYIQDYGTYQGDISIVKA